MKFLRRLIFLVVLVILGAVFIRPETIAAAKEKLTALLHPNTAPRRDLKPRVLLAMMEDRGLTLDQAWEEFDKQVAAAPRYRFQGRVVERLRSGHLLVYGRVSSVGHTLSSEQTSALFGHPDIKTLPLNAPLDIEVAAVGVQRFTDSQGVNISAMEYVYRPPVASQSGDWMKNPSRTKLGEQPWNLR